MLEFLKKCYAQRHTTYRVVWESTVYVQEGRMTGNFEIVGYFSMWAMHQWFNYTDPEGAFYHLPLTKE